LLCTNVIEPVASWDPYYIYILIKVGIVVANVLLNEALMVIESNMRLHV